MPHIVFAPRAIAGLARCQSFLEAKDADAAARASEAINRKLASLATSPESGRPFDGDRRLREVVIGFGSSGYTALYRYEPKRDRVIILALRHQREARY